MLNNIDQFRSLRQLSVPAMGLLLALGIVGEHSRPVLSEQTQQVPTSTELVATTPLTRLRQVREQRNELWDNAQYNKYGKTAPQTAALVGNQKSTKVGTTLPKANTSTVVGVRPERSLRANFSQEDGVYLYGQSPQPNQIGQGYIVFEKHQGRVEGALYVPSSEFSCFQGTLDKSGELAMTIKALPDEGAASQVATNNRLPKTTNDIDVPSTYAHSVALQNYHQIKAVSANDRRILQMCNSVNN